MKTIGMIGGMSWESTAEYYRLINEGVKDRLGGLHSAKTLLYSVDFAEIEILQREGRWDEATDQMIAIAQRLEKGGADFILICANTMHKMADHVQACLHIPILHIADATAQAIKENGMDKVALLGTRFTMEEDFYKGRLIDRYDLEVLIPSSNERNRIHQIIFDELCLGLIRSESRNEYKVYMENLANQGAQGIILGCTELGLLVKDEDSRVPLFDTTRIHALAAVNYALQD